MPHQMRMPSLGQTTDELRIVTWLKAEGDSVMLGEPILEVETDKAILQVESSFAGTVLKILRHVEDIVPAGESIAYIGRPDEIIAFDASASARPVEEVAATASHPANLLVTPIVANNDQVLATPVARRIAKERGIDLRAVQGSGPDGRIEKRDVEALLDLNMTVDMRAARSVVAAHHASGLAGLTFTHLLLQSVARALRAHSGMNRLWRPDGPALRQLARADVGLAIATDDNLLVATIPEPDRVDLTALVRISDDVIGRARKGTLAQTDTAPAAITISNLGMHRVDSFQAIVDPDQTMILAVGRIVDQVVAIEGGIHIVPQMVMSLTVDHRVADGAAAAKFLNAIREDLERSIQ